MLHSTARRDEDDELSVAPPRLGARRLTGLRLQEQHEAAVILVAAATELRHRLSDDTFRAAAALADSVIGVVAEVVGHRLDAYRERLSEAAHFGGLIAAVEERGAGGEPGVIAPHVAVVLAGVEAQFSQSDLLAEQLSRWSLQAGYFLVRTGSATRPLVDALRADLIRLLAEIDEAPRPAVRLPRPAQAPDQIAASVAAGG